MVKRFNHKFHIRLFLIWAVNLTSNDNPHKCGYSGYSAGFNAHSQFVWSDGDWRKKNFVSGVNICSSMNADNREDLHKVYLMSQ